MEYPLFQRSLFSSPKYRLREFRKFLRLQMTPSWDLLQQDDSSSRMGWCIYDPMGCTTRAAACPKESCHKEILISEAIQVTGRWLHRRCRGLEQLEDLKWLDQWGWTMGLDHGLEFCLEFWNSAACSSHLVGWLYQVSREIMPCEFMGHISWVPAHSFQQPAPWHGQVLGGISARFLRLLRRQHHRCLSVTWRLRAMPKQR